MKSTVAIRSKKVYGLMLGIGERMSLPPIVCLAQRRIIACIMEWRMKWNLVFRNQSWRCRSDDPKRKLRVPWLQLSSLF